MMTDQQSTSSEQKIDTTSIVPVATQSTAATISQIFTGMNLSVRVIGTSNEPWFSGVDLARHLGYDSTDQAIRTHVTDGKYKSDLGSLIAKFNPLGISWSGISLKGNAKASIYVNEAGMYALIWGSNKPAAAGFRAWIIEDVLPTIRKTGSYQINSQLQAITSELDAQKRLTDESARLAREAQHKAETEQKRADDAVSAAENLKKDNDALKRSAENVKNAHIADREKRDQTVYILTNDHFKSQDTYKVGRTKNHTASRVSTLNSAHLESDPLVPLYEFNCHNAAVVEAMIHDALHPFRVGDKREFFCLPLSELYNKCVRIVDANVASDADTIDMIKRIMGSPYPGGRDADQRLNELKTDRVSAVLQRSLRDLSNADPDLLREFAKKAVADWKASQTPAPEVLDWMKFQIYLKTWLKDANYPTSTIYRAREWKRMSEAAWTQAG